MSEVPAIYTAIAAVVLVVPGWIVLHFGRSIAGVHTDTDLVDVSKAVLLWSIISNVVFVVFLEFLGGEVDGLFEILAEIYGVNGRFIAGWLAVAFILAFVYAGVLMAEVPRRFREYFQRGQPISRYTDSEWGRFFDDARYVRVYLKNASGDDGPTVIAGNVKQWSRSRKDGELVLNMPWQLNEDDEYEPIVAETEDRTNLPPGGGDDYSVWRSSRILLPEAQINYVVKMPVPPEPGSEVDAEPKDLESTGSAGLES